MIRFHSVEIYNFVTHRHTFFEMADEQSVYIGGLNKDAVAITSNGVGKSLIFDAIFWCLYDSTIRGFGKDQVIGAHDDYAFVETTWYDSDGREIEIKRYRNHPKHAHNVFVKIDGKRSGKTKNTTRSGTNIHIAKLLGMSKETFLYSVIFSRTRKSICEAQPAERIKTLSHIIGLDAIDDGLKSAKSDKKKYTDLLHRLDVKINTALTEIKESKRRLKDLKTSLKISEERDREERKKIQERNDEIEKKIKKLKKERNKIELQLDEMMPELMTQGERKKELDLIRVELSKAMKKKGQAEARLEERLEEYRSSRQAVVRCKEQSGVECPTCKQYISPNFIRKRVFELKKDMSVKKQKKSRAAKRVRDLEKGTKNLRIRIEELESSLRKDIEKKYYELDSRLKYVRSEIKSSKKAKLKKPTVTDTRELKDKIKRLKKKIELSKETHIRMKETYETTSEKLSVSEFWIDGFGSKGLKRFVINGILSVLEAKSNEYLNDLTDGYMTVSWEGDEDETAGRKVVDKLHLNVKVGNGQKRDYLSCSEGEKARVWFATDMALNEIKQVEVDVAFIDECFDGMDKNGVEKAIALITSESMKRKMVCISHREGVGKHFSNKKVVVMENGTSTLKAA